MKKNKISPWIIVWVILAFALLQQAGLFSLIGRTGYFTLTDYECKGDVDACRPNSIKLVARPDSGSSSGEAIARGYVETIPDCGKYELNLKNIDAGGTQCGSKTYIDVLVNDVEVGSWSVEGVADRTPSTVVIDITNEVARRANNTLSFKMQVVHDGDSDRSCGVSAGSTSITGFECFGDRLFVQSCPLPGNKTIMGIEFSSGVNVSLADFPDDVAFCTQNPVIIKDMNNQVVGKTDQPYIDLDDGKEVSVPEGQSYIFIYITEDPSIDLQDKIDLIKSLEGDIQTQANILKQLNLTLQENVVLIDGLKLSIKNQAIFINQLTENLATKAYYVSQLQAENELQAELIKEMEDSFTRQGGILRKLNKTTEDDAKIIQSLSTELDSQKKISEQLGLDNTKLQRLVKELEENQGLQQGTFENITTEESPIKDEKTTPQKDNTTTLLIFAVIIISILTIISKRKNG